MEKRDEKKPSVSDSAIKVDAGDRSGLVMAKVPQGYDTNINVRLVPGRNIGVAAIPLVCRPRNNAPRRDAEPLDLPPDLVDKLKQADPVVVAWLAADEANVQLFMARPAEALVKAGVNLTRADQKAIHRSHSEVNQAMVVGPGVKVESFKATAFTKGKIGKIKPGANAEDDPKDNIGCVKE